MKKLSEITAFLKAYDGPKVNLMEVCGTHTSVIARSGIREMLSPNIRLISGPGCPVCVTQGAFIDRLCDLAAQPDTTVATFGDMIKVRGARSSLYTAKAAGADVWMLYSPMNILERAKNNPGRRYIMAAVGFETTAPVYALMLQRMEEEGITNVRLLTSLKRMAPALGYICGGDNDVQGFLAPGNVSAVIGSNAYADLCREFRKPFTVAGFTPPDILFAVYDLLEMISHNKPQVHNLYRGVVCPEGNPQALALLERYFQPEDSEWRSIGSIPGSGMFLRPEYADFDAGSRLPLQSEKPPAGCRCREVILGRLQPGQCGLFGKICTPDNPVGPCMVSSEGSCGIHYREGIGR